MSGHSKDDDNEEIWRERCLNCIRCSVKVNCESCSACRNNRTCEARRCFSAKKLYNEKVKKLADENLKQIMAKTAAREAQSAAASSSQLNEEPEKKKRGRRNGATVAAAGKKINERNYVPSRPTRQQSADLRRKRTQFSQAEPSKQPRQCLNPDCIYESRPESKYCSDECGRTLARLRLTEILPIRCKQYFSGAPRNHEEELKHKRAVINKDMQELTNAEKHMMRFLEKMHEFVESLSKCAPEAADDRDDDNMYEACVVCGHPDIPLRKYAKHIELCWSRSEKAISFGAPEKNNDNFYCEKFDARTNTYCKRLKSLCPEHRKAGVEQCLKICGYPKKWEKCNVGDNAKTLSEIIEMEDPFGDEGCMTKKDVCSKHHKWLPSLRGSIELEQACLFQKMFELCHETHKLNSHAEWSTNALSIMMHKPPKIVDEEQFAEHLKAMSSENSMDQSATTSTTTTSSEDPTMSETAQVLASLSVQKPEEPESTPNQLLSPNSLAKQGFSMARLLE